MPFCHLVLNVRKPNKELRLVLESLWITSDHESLEQYFDFNVQHFHEKLKAEHKVELSYTWVKQALQERDW